MTVTGERIVTQDIKINWARGNDMVKQKKIGGAWYYEFMIQGKRYFGTCEGCKCRRDAEVFERTMRAKVLQGAGLKSVKALYETFREDLTGGKRISLAEAYDLAEQKPRTRMPSAGHAATKRAIWRDFLAFLQGEHPDVKILIDVTEAHAQEYIARLQKNGRYEKTVSYSRGTGKNSRTVTMQKTDGALSARTLHLYQIVCAEVFTLLEGCGDTGQSFCKHSPSEVGRGDTRGVHAGRTQTHLRQSGWVHSSVVHDGRVDRVARGRHLYAQMGRS